MTFQPYKHVYCNVTGLCNRHESFITQKSLDVTRGGLTYYCQLCQMDLVDSDDAELHCTNSSCHKRRVEKIRDLQNDPTACRCAKIQLGIDRLGLPSWQQAIQIKLYWAFMNQSLADHTIRDAYIQEASQLVIKYTKMEETSLLELAIWKAVCITSKPYSTIIMSSESSLNSSSNEYHLWQNWIRHGWKEQKDRVRREQSTEIGTIVTLVYPYLYGTTTMESNEEICGRGKSTFASSVTATAVVNNNNNVTTAEFAASTAAQRSAARRRQLHESDFLDSASWSRILENSRVNHCPWGRSRRI